MKSFKIEIPKGYEIDKENSTFENIVFKEVNKSAMSWDELGEIEGYYIHSDSNISNRLLLSTVDKDNKNLFPTLKDAESSLALAQLLQLRKNWIGEWELSQGDYDFCSIDATIHGSLCLITKPRYFNELSFPNDLMAKDFLEAHGELIRVYFKM